MAYGLTAVAFTLTAGRATPAYAAPAEDLRGDGWRFNRTAAQVNPFFSEFKYFNFQDSKISGAMTYAVMSPGYSRSLRLNAFFYEGGKLHSIQKNYPLKCVNASDTDLAATFCGEGSIEVLAWGPSEVRLRVRQETGPIRWALEITTPMSQHTPLATRFDLGKDVVDWHMNWSPVLRSGRVQGTVTIHETGSAPRTLEVDTETSYHDENWEVWYPPTQPFNWLHFTALDSRGERADLTLVEFPRSHARRQAKTAGLTLFSQGSSKFWEHGQYSLTREGKGMIPVTRHFGASAEKIVTHAVDASFASGERPIPRRYRITTDDHQLTALLSVRAALATSSSKPGTKNEFVVEEQLLDAEATYLTAQGELRTISGPAEFMNTGILGKPQE